MDDMLPPAINNFAQDGTLSLPLLPSKLHKMIAINDIGQFAAPAALTDRYLGEAIDIVGDGLTPVEIANILSNKTGREIRYEQMADDQALKVFGEELKIMFDWFNRSGYSVNVEDMKAIATFDLIKYGDVVRVKS
jgi:uncharacterized protein YbjT (DUF2867 family)